MKILTKDELNLCKKEARKREIRQNVKSHCTKIKDGIQKNGSTSANRAIWELFQNAGDLATYAEIRITLTKDAFIFEHKGRPFTYDSLCSLVKQVSSQEKEGKDTVGQYGTGFLTTHTFSRKIAINGSMLISEDPVAYVDINEFLINRENFDDIPQFIEDMTEQIEAVEKLMDNEQKCEKECQSWTKLSYELNEERKMKVQTAIDEAIKLMPYVLTFNDNIGSCEIRDETRDISITFSKETRQTSVEDLLCIRVWKSKDKEVPIAFDCFYLELHDGESRIILPLKSETEVYSLKDIPRLFVHFPLIGSDYFGVNFLFHSHRFTPEEPRDNIIVPKDNDATDKIAKANKKVLDEMTQYLWAYLDKHVASWKNTIKMASLNIKDIGYSEVKTETYYKELKRSWVAKFSELKLIEILNERYSMNDANHPLVLDPTLEAFLSEDKPGNYLTIVYSYAKGTALIPNEDELLRWSQIIAKWDISKTTNFLSLETIVKYVSKNQGEHLYDMLNMIVVVGHTEYFEKYALLPNRRGELKQREDLRDARAITEELYKLVNSIDTDICTKMVDIEYADIIKLNPYSRQNLREELNAIVKKKEDECWRKEENPHPYDGEFEQHLIALCSTFVTLNGDSKRNKLMPIICTFEGVEYKEKHMPAWKDDASNFDLYRQIFVSLVENQMMKIAQKKVNWVSENIDDLVDFVDNARGDDYKIFCTRYAIYPDLKGSLHTPDELKNNFSVSEMLFELYQQIKGEDLRNKCVDSRFVSFYDKYAENDYRFTSQNVAKEIQNKLSDDKYTDIILLDIIDLTELNNSEGLQWRILFKDIYDQRESIRYNLGTPIERKAINRMMKKKNPQLLEIMADVSERNDANVVINALNQTITNIDHEAHIKMLGDYVENHIQEYLTDALLGDGVAVRNEQGGQDLILSKGEYDNYYIEIKSRWIDKASVIMSSTQFHNAVVNANCYSLVSVQMWTFDQQRVIDKKHVELSEMKNRIKVCDKIGTLEVELEKRVNEAFKFNEGEISAVGSYEVHVPQKVFSLSFEDLIKKMKLHFSN